MDFFKTALVWGAAGPVYLSLVFIIGLAATRRWSHEGTPVLERAALAVCTGLVIHAAVTALMLWCAPRWIGVTLWVLAGASTVLLPSKPFRWQPWHPLLGVLAYALACYVLLLCAHYGPQRGATIFWTIYNLSFITPGDSPQSAFQAQYLLHAGHLAGMEGFSLFDRPFLGGLITAGALGAFGLQLGTDFYQYSDPQALAYTSLWITLNATAALPLLAIVSRFATGHAARVAAVLLLASPFFVFNAIGLWPKLLALGVLALACLMALRNRPVLAVSLSGLAFFIHGSFLWPHIAFTGVLILALIYLLHALPRQAAMQVAKVGLVAIAFPLLWFGAEHLSGGNSPLRTYYLYNVHVTYGFHHTAAEAASQFYRSTNPENLAALPLMNLVKGFLPIELMTFIVQFDLHSEPIHWRSIGQAWFGTQFYRMWYALCLTCAAVAFKGAFSAQGGRWLPRLALVAFVLLPLIPGTGLYRRDDHFLLNISMSSMLALLVFLSIGLQSLSLRALHAVSGLALAEFALVFLSRYPAVSSVGEFRAAYVVAVLALLATALYLLASRRVGAWLASAEAGKETAR